MKIQILRLKNFIGIYSGMKLKEITLDFSKHDFSMYLLAGKNGSGKTTIMKALNPLPGTASEIIREGKEGEKEIILEDEDFIYKIRHVYVPTKSTHKISSYIEKIDMYGNTMDLNPNGNVTSFKEILEQELNICDDYLKLVRLGSSFASFISMSTSERSKFISKFLSDVDIYLRLHKKVSDDVRLLKNMVKNVSNKLDKIGSKEEIESDLIIVEKTLLSLKETRDKFIADRATYINFIKEEKLDEIDEVMREKDELKIVLNELKDMQEDLCNIAVEISGNVDNFRNYDNLVKLAKSQLDKKETQCNSLTELYKTRFDMLNTLSEELENDEIELEKIGDIEYLMSIKGKYQDTKDKIKNLEIDYGFNKELPDYTVSELLMVSEIFDGYKERIENLHEQYNYDLFDDLYFDNQNLQNYKIKYKKKEHAIECATIELNKLSNELSVLESKITDIKDKYKLRPSNCTISNCALLGGDLESTETKYYAVQEMYDNGVNELEALNSTLNKLADKIDICETIIKLKKEIDKNYNTFVKIPFLKRILKDENEFDKCVRKNKAFYVKDAVEVFCNIVEESEVYKSLINTTMPILKTEYMESKNKIERYNILKNKIKVKTHQLEQTRKQCKELDEKLDNCTDSRKIARDIYDTLQYMDNVNELYDTLDRYIELDSICKQFESKISELKEVKSKLKTVEQAIIGVGKDIEKTEEKRNKLNFKKMEIKKFTKEKKMLEKDYKDTEMVRTSLSSNKGVPLIHIEIYLQKVRLIANDLLERAFGGSLKLDKFVINDKEFRMPFTSDGGMTYASDASKGSEGEKVILSLVLSFAFTSQISSNFNVILLDEVDGPLDKKNRRMFADVIQKQMDILHVEQLFIISHNDAFLSQDMGYILLKDNGLDNIRRDNVVFDYYEE